MSQPGTDEGAATDTERRQNPTPHLARKVRGWVFRIRVPVTGYCITGPNYMSDIGCPAVYLTGFRAGGALDSSHASVVQVCEDQGILQTRGERHERLQISVIMHHRRKRQRDTRRLAPGKAMCLAQKKGLVYCTRRLSERGNGCEHHDAKCAEIKFLVRGA